MSVLFSERYPASASSVPLARHDVIDALTAAEFSDPDLLSRVALTLSEATGNVARHAYPHGGNEYMEVVVNETAGTVMIAVTDYGVGMNSTRIGLPSLGLGLPTMRAQTTSVEIRSDTNGTVVTLHFERAHPGATDVPWADGRPMAGASRQWCACHAAPIRVPRRFHMQFSNKDIAA